jgi:hypothetical protein
MNNTNKIIYISFSLIVFSTSLFISLSHVPEKKEIKAMEAINNNQQVALENNQKQKQWKN